jgi:hypothetical protein
MQIGIEDIENPSFRADKDNICKKAYGIKQRCYRERVEEHSQNMRNKWGT